MVLGKKKALNATSSSQGEEFEGKKGGTSLEKEQDEGDMTGEQTERQQWLKLSCSSLEVTGHSSAVMAGSSDAGSEEHMFSQLVSPKHKAHASKVAFLSLQVRKYQPLLSNSFVT